MQKSYKKENNQSSDYTDNQYNEAILRQLTTMLQDVNEQKEIFKKGEAAKALAVTEDIINKALKNPDTYNLTNVFTAAMLSRQAIRNEENTSTKNGNKSKTNKVLSLMSRRN